MQANVLHRRAGLAAIVMAALFAWLLLPVAAMADVPSVNNNPPVDQVESLISKTKTVKVSKTNKLAAEKQGGYTGNVRVFQEFSSEYTGVERTFEYRMVPVEADDPMPEGTENGVYVWTFTDNDSGWISIPGEGVSFEGKKDRVLHYVVYQNVTDPKPDYTYDDRWYYLDLHFVPGFETPVVTLENMDGKKVNPSETDPGWTVTYNKKKAEPSEQTGTYQNANTTTAGTTAQTGDTSMDMLLPVLGVALAVLVIGLVVRRKSGDDSDE